LDLRGGAPHVLTEAPVGRGGTWNRDGVIVFSPSTTSGLMRIPATGGVPAMVTRPAAGQTSHRWPQFLPDGRHVLFLGFLAQPETTGIYLASLDGGEPARVLATDTSALFAPPGYLLLVSQDTLVARRFDPARGVLSGGPLLVAQSVGSDSGLGRVGLSISDAGVLAHRGGAAGRRQLVWFDRSGQTLSRVGAAEVTSLVFFPELARDGARVAFHRTVNGNTDVWLIQLKSGIASRFTYDVAVDAGPVWSPDGARIVFLSSRNGRFDLFEKMTSGATDERPLLVTGQDKAPQDWSPDGQTLLYTTQDPKTLSDLWALPLTGDREPFPVAQTSFDEVQGQFSPDGRWVAYASNETGRYEIYLRRFPDGGGKQQMTTEGGISPRWRRDGRELFYLTRDDQLMVVPIQPGADSRTVSAGAPSQLFATRIAIGGNIGGFSSKAQYAVAPNGRFLLNVNTDDTALSPITIVQNWTAVLKK
jgi:Tol biopolymer transport system component